MRFELDELEGQVGHVPALVLTVQAVPREISEDVGRTNSDLHLLVSVPDLLQGSGLGFLLYLAPRPVLKYPLLGFRVLVDHIGHEVHVVPQEEQQELLPGF